VITITQEVIEEACNLIAEGVPQAVGYRLMIKPIEASTQMELAEKKKNPELANVGFIMKTNYQAEKETRGTHHGILVNKGEFAFRADQLGSKDWVSEGDVLIFDRYSGVVVELPPGSGEKYRFTNDESVLGKMVPRGESKNTLD